MCKWLFQREAVRSAVGGYRLQETRADPDAGPLPVHPDEGRQIQAHLFPGHLR